MELAIFLIQAQTWIHMWTKHPKQTFEMAYPYSYKSASLNWCHFRKNFFLFASLEVNEAE